MAEPSLLCVNCAQPPPAHRRTWNRCTICVERNLPSTYYCGQECMNAHWPKHQEYHKVQKQQAKKIREGTVRDTELSVAEEVARRGERTGNEFDKRGAAALALGAKGDYYAAAKAWRKLINEWPHRPEPYHNLAVVLDRADRVAEAASFYLKAVELYEEGTEDWAGSTASAFDLLRHSECDEEPKPEVERRGAQGALGAGGGPGARPAQDVRHASACPERRCDLQGSLDRGPARSSGDQGGGHVVPTCSYGGTHAGGQANIRGTCKRMRRVCGPSAG